jgi:hypothetical protein
MLTWAGAECLAVAFTTNKEARFARPSIFLAVRRQRPTHIFALLNLEKSTANYPLPKNSPSFTVVKDETTWLAPSKV